MSLVRTMRKCLLFLALTGVGAGWSFRASAGPIQLEARSYPGDCIFLGPLEVAWKTVPEPTTVFPLGAFSDCDADGLAESCHFLFYTYGDEIVEIGDPLENPLSSPTTLTAWFKCHEPGPGGSGPPEILILGFDLSVNDFMDGVEVIADVNTTPEDAASTAADGCCGCWPGSPAGTTPCSIYTGPDPSGNMPELEVLEDLTALDIKAKSEVGGRSFQRWYLPMPLGSIPAGPQASGDEDLPNTGSLAVSPTSRPTGVAVAVYESDACRRVLGNLPAMGLRCRGFRLDKVFVFDLDDASDRWFVDRICWYVSAAALGDVRNCPGCEFGYCPGFDLVIDEGGEYFDATIRDARGTVVAKEKVLRDGRKVLSFQPGSVYTKGAEESFLALQPRRGLKKGTRVQLAMHIEVRSRAGNDAK